jgi:putative tryptophan/tyrosine transport system substrate-binding protein
LPSLSANATVPRSGGLISYSAGAFFRETAAYVDKLLKGAKPADLPVSFPSKFDLIVNLQTAKALGLTIPPILLARRRSDRIERTPNHLALRRTLPLSSRGRQLRKRR